jgi:hypothetical protein
MTRYRPRSTVCGRHLKGRQPNWGPLAAGDQPNVTGLSVDRRRAATPEMGRNAGKFSREEDGVMQPELRPLRRLCGNAL